MFNFRLLMRFISLLVSIFFYFSFTQLIIAQTTPWTDEEFVKIFHSTVLKPDVYLQDNSPILDSNDTYVFTSTPCVDNSSCSPGDVCLPNSDVTPQKYCATPQHEANWNITIESTDYTPDLTQSQKLPKLQNLSQHYLQNPPHQVNQLNYGSLELLLPATYKLELKLAALQRAFETSNKGLVVGYMPNRELHLPDGTTTTYVDLYNQLPGYLKTKPKGWQQQALQDSNPLIKAISFVNPSPYDIAEYAYAYHEAKITFFGFPVTHHKVVPYKVHPRGDLFTTYEYAKITLPSVIVKPFKSDPSIVALTDTTHLVSNLPNTENYDNYFSNLANNHNLPTLPNVANKPQADAKQPTNSSSLLGFISYFFQVTTLTKNFPSPSQITTNKLVSLIGAHNITAQELSSKPLSDKAFPALTSATNFDLNMGQGGGISSLTDTFSRLISCEADVYSTEIPIKDYLGGVRQSCSPPIPSVINGNACGSSITLAELAAATQKIGNKYGLPPKWLEAMFQYEGGNAKMGTNCVEETIYKVMGPLQISHSAYSLATCENERFPDPASEQSQCSDSAKLSRCSLEGSLELAARTLLQKLNAYGYYQGAYDCQAVIPVSVSLEALYRATNAYSGCGLVNGIPYAQAICQYAGNCPSPLPPIGDPITCQGN